jgi:3-methylfumaryl-CoA hydratase
MRHGTRPRPSLHSYVADWRPSPQTDEDVLSPKPAQDLAAVLDVPAPAARAGDPLPPLWQWLYFLGLPRGRELCVDGHPERGPFLPPVPGRQRLWAGGRLQVTEPLRIGGRTERVSALDTVTVKQGRSGELLVVTQRSEYRQSGRTCLVEEQDIVYRSGRSASNSLPSSIDPAAEPRSDEPWQCALRPDPVLLFRFSALTANAHRIHYDAPYCQNEEGYPGIVVHGPLLALLMLDLVRRHAPARAVRSLRYRLNSPAFAGEHLLACGTTSGTGARLRVASHREPRHATAEVTYA